MFKITEKSHGQRLLSLVLAVILLFSFIQFNVQPAAADTVGTVDVAVVSVRVSGNSVTTTLRLVQGTAPESIQISYYRNGKQITGTNSQTLKWSGLSAAVEAEISGLGTTGSLTVIIGVSGDTNLSNNNRTATLGASPDQPQPPASVTNLRGSATQTTITLTWTASADADSYRVLDKNGNVIATVTGTSYTATGLTPDTSYTYYVVAVRDGATSGRASITCKTQAEVTPTEPEPTETQPTTVKDVQISHSGETTNSVTLTWGTVTGSTGVEPETYTVTIGGQTHTATAAGSHTFTGLTAGQTYTYKVVASANGKTSSEATGTVTLPKPTTPDSGVKTPSIEHSAASFTSVTLTWGYDSTTDGEVPTKYIITIGDQTFEASAPGTKAITGLTMGQKYDYSVKAVYGDKSAAASGSVQLKSSAELASGIDLVVTDIILNPANPAAGDPVSFSAVITNQGNAASNNVKHGVRFYVDNVSGGQSCATVGFYWSDEYQSSLASGASVVVHIGGSYLPAQDQTTWTATTGSHTVTAYVDDSTNKDTGDSNTSNNYLTRQFTVSPKDSGSGGDDGGNSGINPSANTPARSGNHAANTKTGNIYTFTGAYRDLTTAKDISVSVTGTNGTQSSTVFLAQVNESRYWAQSNLKKMPVTILEMDEAEGKPATVTITTTFDVNDVTVRPLSANIQAEKVSAKQIKLTIPHTGNYSVEFNGSTDNALQLFVNPYYQNKGDNYLGLGEVRYGSEIGRNISGYYGSGVVIGNQGNDAATKAYSNSTIEGITLLNTQGTSWEVEIRAQDNIVFDYFHIIASGNNSDGISIQSSSNIFINHSYFRTWDDAVVLKNQYDGGNTHDIYVDNCVFWSDLAQAMEIGAETNKYGRLGDPQIYNAAFRDSTAIHAYHKSVMSIHNMDNANVHDITWRNITIEDAQMGNNGGNGKNGDGWPYLIDVTNTVGGELPGTANTWTTVSEGARGSIYNVTFENIKVLSWNNDTGKAPGVRFMNSEWGGTITNVWIKGLDYNGQNIGDLDTLRSATISQLEHMNDVPGAWPSATKDSGHDNSYNCRGEGFHASEAFDTTQLHFGSAS